MIDPSRFFRSSPLWRGLIGPLLLVGLLLPSAAAAADDAPPSIPLPVASPADAPTFAFNPPSATARVGDVLTVQMVVNAGDLLVDAAQALVQFDPTLLEVVGADGAPASGVSGGSSLSLGLLNSADNAAGEVRYAAGAAFSTPDPSGSFTLATISFHALAPGAVTLAFGTGVQGTQLVTPNGTSSTTQLGTATILILPA